MTEEYDGSTELPNLSKDRRREQFCHEYVVDFNATQACIRAGYAASGARTQGSRLLANDNISKRVNHLANEVRKNVKVDAEYVLRELKLQYETDLTAIQDEMGNILDPRDWPADVRKVIEGFDSNMIADKDGNTGGLLINKVRRTSRLKALELLGRHKSVQAFQEKVELDATDNLVDAILNARKRARGESDD